MADDPLNRARRQLLASTDQLLSQLDQGAVGESFRGIAPSLAAARHKARERALDIVTERARKTVADKLGMDLGWQFFDRARWSGPEVDALYSARLDRVAAWLSNAQARGRDSKELLLWTRYWQHQIAGSDVHKVARGATADIAGNTPVLGRLMRIAEPGACAWCRGLATRGAVYYSRDTALVSGHAHCRCEVTEVTDASRIAETRNAGAQAWDESTLSGQENPFRGRSSGAGGSTGLPQIDPALTRQGALTPERRVAIQAQLNSYQAVIESGKGTDWMRAKMLELAEELDELDRLGIGARAKPVVEELPEWHRTVRAAAERLPKDRSLIGKLDDGSWDVIDAKVYKSSTITRAPGPTAVEHMNAVMDAGRALDDELERRIAARLTSDPKEIARLRREFDAAWDIAQDTYLEALKLIPENVASGIDPMALDDAQRRFLQRYWRLDKGLGADDLDPWRAYENAKRALLEAQAEIGSRRYNDIVQEEALKLLAEVRDMGNGVGSTYLPAPNVSKANADLALDAMRRANEVYPTDWVNSARNFRPEVTLKVTDRGYNSAGNTIALSKKATQLTNGAVMDRVAVHELGHTMESAIPGLRTTEWIYHWMRSIPGYDGTGIPVRPSKVGIYSKGGKEVAIADEWRELYSGKFYSPNGVNAWNDHYEIFTTGVESLMSGSPYFYGRDWSQLSELGVDREFRSYILGVLSVL